MYKQIWSIIPIYLLIIVKNIIKTIIQNYYEIDWYNIQFKNYSDALDKTGFIWLYLILILLESNIFFSSSYF